MHITERNHLLWELRASLWTPALTPTITLPHASSIEHV